MFCVLGLSCCAGIGTLAGFFVGCGVGCVVGDGVRVGVGVALGRSVERTFTWGTVGMLAWVGIAGAVTALLLTLVLHCG